MICMFQIYQILTLEAVPIPNIMNHQMDKQVKQLVYSSMVAQRLISKQSKWKYSKLFKLKGFLKKYNYFIKVMLIMTQKENNKKG